MALQEELKKSNLQFYSDAGRVKYYEPGVSGRISSGLGELVGITPEQIKALGYNVTPVATGGVEEYKAAGASNPYTAKQNFNDLASFESYLSKNYTLPDQSPVPVTFQSGGAVDPNSTSGGRAALEQSLVSKGLPAPTGGFQTLTPTNEQMGNINVNLQKQIQALPGAGVTPTLMRNPGESITDFTKRVMSQADTSTSVSTGAPGAGGVPSTTTGTSQTGTTTGGGTPGIQTSDRARAASIEALKQEFTPAGLPAAQNTAQQRIDLRKEQGIVNDEADLADVLEAGALIDLELRNFRSKAGERVTESSRLGAISEQERSASFRLQELAIREQSIRSRISAKTAAIDQIIQDQRADYQTALQQWQISYKINQDAVEATNRELEQDQKEALATVNTLTSLMKESGLSYDQLSPDIQQQMQSAAIRIGLPKDTFATFYNKLAAGDSVLSTVVQKTSSGSDIYAVVRGSDGTIRSGVVSGGKVPSFEDYLRQKESEAESGLTPEQAGQQTFAQSTKDELRKEYNSLYGDQQVSQLSQQLDFVISGKSKDSRNNAIATFNKYVQAGNYKAAENYLNKLAFDSFTAAQKEEYNALGTTSKTGNGTLVDLDTFKLTEPGLYKSAVEKAKTFAALKRDNKYTELMQDIELAQSQIRKALFGASLTEGEQQSANRFAITENDDIGTIETKLKGLVTFSNQVRERYINEQKGITESVENERPDLGTFVNPITDYIR